MCKGSHFRWSRVQAERTDRFWGGHKKNETWRCLRLAHGIGRAPRLSSPITGEAWEANRGRTKAQLPSGSDSCFFQRFFFGGCPTGMVQAQKIGFPILFFFQGHRTTEKGRPGEMGTDRLGAAVFCCVPSRDPEELEAFDLLPSFCWRPRQSRSSCSRAVLAVVRNRLFSDNTSVREGWDPLIRNSWGKQKETQ